MLAPLVEELNATRTMGLVYAGSAASSVTDSEVRKQLHELYQRLYRDRTRWSKRDTADPVLQVVVYNGDRRWDAPVTLAGLVVGQEQDGPAQLALSYEVVDLVALKRDCRVRTC